MIKFGNLVKQVYVVAWEYSPGCAGSSGFDWFVSWKAAEMAYSVAERGDDWASFFTTYQIEPDDDTRSITAAIDGELAEVCANAATRTVGANVRKYWNEMGFDMSASIN